MDFGPNNWYPEPVPMWNLQTPTIFVPPSPTLVNPPLSPPPHCSPHFIPPFQSPSVPTFIPDPVAVQIIDAFAGFRQTMDECFNDFKVDLGKVQERLHERGRLIKELRSKVSSAVTPPGPRYAPEDPTLPSPWKGLIDGSTGSLYYWNTATNQTQYERPCPHAQITHPTQPIYLRSKQLRGLRRRVSMAATRRLVKDTRKPDLLSRVGKYSGSKLNRKHGLWAVKAQNGEAFSDIMEAIRQHCVVIETSTTNPSFSPLISEVTEQHAVLFSVAVADEVSLPSTKPTSDDTVVPNGATTGAATACAHELDPDLICLNPLPSVTEYDPSQLSIESGQAEVPTADSCFSSSTPGPDVVVDVSSAATAIGSKLAEMVEPLKLETVAKCGSGPAGFISITENCCPDSAMVQLIAMKTELNNKEFALVYHSCKLGNFSQARRVLCVKFSLDSTMITDASFSCGYICEEQLFAGDKYGHMLVNAAMGATTQPSLSQVSLTPHFNYQDVRRVLVSFLSGVIKPSTYGPLHSKVGEETWLLDDRIEKMNGDADTLFASQSPRKLTLDCFLVATDLASQMVPLGGSETVNKRVNMPMVIVSSLSWLAILLSKVIRRETDERNRPPTRGWLNCCLFLWDCKLNVATLAALAGTMHAWLNGTLNCLPLVEGVTKLDIMDKDTAARIPSPKNADSYKCAQFSADGRFLLSSPFERFVEVVETPRKGPQFSVKVLAVFINRQPITLLQWVYLRTLDHATLPNALCFAPTCTDSVQLLTHRAMTSILLQLHSYMQELGLRTHMHVLDYLFMTSWAYIVCALPLCVTTTCMADITRDNHSLSAVVVCPVPCQCQPRWSFVDKVIASVNSISELSFMRYYYAPLLPSDYGVFPMTYMNMCFQYMVSHVHQDMFFMVTHSSVFYSPFYTLVKKLFLLSPMTAIQLLGSLLAHILRDDDRYIIGILVLNSIIQVVSLKSTQHGIAIRYSAILTGNYCSHVRCLIYSPEFMNTWVIQFSFVAIDFGYPVLIPSLHFSLPMRSIEGLLLLLLPTIINCQLMDLVVSSTLLQSSNGDTLRVLRVFSHTLLLTNSQASAHLWVHHYVFKGCICLLKLRMELPYMPHIVVAILCIGIIQPLSDFKAVEIFLLPDFIVIWIDITVGDRLWGTVAKHDTMIEFRTTITAFGTTRTSPVSGTPRRHTNSMAYMFSLATMESNDDFAASAKQGRNRVFMQLKSYFYELLALVPVPMKSSSSFDYSHHFISQALSHYVQSFHSTLFLVLLLLVAYVDSRSPDKVGSEENMVSVDVTEASQNVNDSVDEGVLHSLEELLVTPLLESVAQMVIVFKKLTCGALLSSYAASDKPFEGVISTVMVENDPVVKVIYVDSSIKDAYLPMSCYDETVFAYPKTNAAEDHHLLVQFFFYLGDLYTRTEKIRESLSYHPTTLQIYVKSVPGTAPTSRASNLTDIAATYKSVNELEQTVNLSQPAQCSSLRTSLFSRGEDLLGSLLLGLLFLYQPSCYARAHK